MCIARNIRKSGLNKTYPCTRYHKMVSAHEWFFFPAASLKFNVARGRSSYGLFGDTSTGCHQDSKQDLLIGWRGDFKDRLIVG